MIISTTEDSVYVTYPIPIRALLVITKLAGALLKGKGEVVCEQCTIKACDGDPVPGLRLFRIDKAAP